MRETYRGILGFPKFKLLTGGLLSVGFAALYASSWAPLKMQGIGGGHNYSDLSSVVNAAKCYEEIGSRVFTVTGDCSYQYGLFLLKFINFFHLNSISTFVLGGFFFIFGAVLLTLIGVWAVERRSHVYLAPLLLLSPGAWLLLERGNFDLLNILFITIAILSLNTRISPLGAVLLLATALMKFYTFPLLLLFILLEKNKWLRVAVAISSIVIIQPMVKDIISAPSHPNPMFAAFGLPVPGLWVNFFAWRFNFDILLNMYSLYAVGFILFFVALLYFYFGRASVSMREKFSNMSFSSELDRNIFLFSSLTYVSCFIAGSNFDYRLIFLSISLVLVNKALMDSIHFKILVSLELSALWLTYFYFGATGPIPVLLSITGNAAQLILAVILSAKLAEMCFLELKKSIVSRLGFRP